MKPDCLHCRSPRPTRPRGLCNRCYRDRSVRDRFPAHSKFARRGVGDFNGKTSQAALPTSALPGTEEKIRVLGERARLGLHLWHPHDGPGGLEW